jgi:hypothetical protein
MPLNHPRRIAGAAGARRSFDRRPLLAILTIVGSGLAAPAAPAAAAPYDGRPKILLHRMGVTLKNPCSRALLADCRTAVTDGAVGSPAYVYVLGVRGSLPSVSAVQCGLVYGSGEPAARTDRAGIDIFEWTRCATLEYPSGSPRPWPGPGGGNLVVYDAVQACQVGETAVMGYFYLNAYSPDALNLVARPASGLAGVTDCGAAETPLGPADLGAVAFTVGGGGGGCNPCLGPCPEAPPFPAARCVLTPPASTAFPTVPVGDGNNHRKIVLRNDGGQPLTGRLALDSPHFRVWAARNDYLVPPYESREYWITFQPQAPGDHVANLTIGSGCPGLTFTGTAIEYTDCHIGPSTQFSATRIGDSRENVLAVWNAGPGRAVGTIFLDRCSGDFSLVGDPTFDLGPRETAERRIRFTPTRVEFQECRVLSTSPLCFGATVSGTGYVGEPQPPVCTLWETPVDFGEVMVGGTGSGHLHARNDGGGQLFLQILPDCDDFRADPGFAPTMRLGAGEDGIVRLEFRPTRPGPITCELRMSDCAPVTLTGIGRLPGPGLLAPTALDFGTVPVGQTLDRAFTITNSGGGPIRGVILSDREEFRLVGPGAYDLAPGASATFQVRFTSGAPGPVAGRLDAGADAAILPVSAVAEEPTPVRPSSWSAIKARFSR